MKITLSKKEAENCLRSYFSSQHFTITLDIEIEDLGPFKAKVELFNIIWENARYRGQENNYKILLIKTAMAYFGITLGPAKSLVESWEYAYGEMIRTNKFWSGKIKEKD